jgi:hypothetical protein
MIQRTSNPADVVCPWCKESHDLTGEALGSFEDLYECGACEGTLRIRVTLEVNEGEPPPEDDDE